MVGAILVVKYFIGISNTIYICQKAAKIIISKSCLYGANGFD